jgi:hypothetical protein
MLNVTEQFCNDVEYHTKDIETTLCVGKEKVVPRTDLEKTALVFLAIIKNKRKHNLKAARFLVDFHCFSLFFNLFNSALSTTQGLIRNRMIMN